MLVSSSISRRWIAGGVLAGLTALTASLSFADDGVFADLQGSWAGQGALSLSDGRNETIRCRVKYFVSPSGHNLDQQLRCASDSYRFDVNSGLVQTDDGLIAGTWQETTRNVGGSVRARRDGNAITAKIAGPSFSANMVVTTDGDHQQVQITPSGGDIASVTIDLTRA